MCTSRTVKDLKKKMTSKSLVDKITILGIGNILYSDEGIGIHILPILEEEFEDDDNIEVIEGSTDGIKLLGPIEDADNLIIIDAINAEKEGGDIISLEGDDLPVYFGIKMSVHQMSFQEVLMAVKLRDRYPKNIIMFGMQPTSLEFGLGLTANNQKKLPDLAKAVINQVDFWRSRGKKNINEFF